MENNKEITESGGNPVDDFNLGLLIYVVNKSIVWVIVVIIISIALAFVYLRYAARIYQASSTLMMKTEKTTEILGVKNLIKDQQDETEISQEIQLMQSSMLINRVINHLPLQIGYYKEGKTKFVFTELYTTSPFEVEGSLRSNDILNVPIYLKIIGPGKIYVSFSMSGKEYEDTKDTGATFSNPYFNIRVKLKGNLNKDDFAGIYYFKFLNKSDLVDEIATKLQILPVDPRTKTLTIQYADRSTARAKDIIATMSREFIKYDIERKRESFINILNFIDNQIDTFGFSSDKFQDSITGEKIKDGFLQGDNYLSQLTQKAMEFEERSRDYQDDIALLRSFKSLLNENKDYGNLPSPQFKETDISFENDIININTLQQKRNELLLDVTTQHPNIRTLDKQIEDEKSRLNKVVDNAIVTLQDRLNIIRDGYRKYMDEIFRMPGLQSKFERLDKMADIRNDFVMNLIGQKSNYLIASAGIVSDYVILQDAITDPVPISPNETFIEISGVGIGFFIGLVIIAVRYLLHNTIISIDEVEKKTKAPLLGIIPRYKEELERSQIVVTQDPKASITEAFRAIRTNLQFIANTPGPKILSTTSTIPGEGKTFVSLNIAAILSLLNRKVIILDFDMRKPRLDKIFDVESHRGVSTILSGQTGIDECIMESGIPHLDFITSGPVPPNPSELILLPKLQDLIIHLKEKYEYIIIDTPPIGLVTDALEILKISDYPIYILRAAYSNRTFVNSINRIISESKIKNLSVVINDYGRGASGYGASYGYSYGYNYGYSYGYGYGYGYGYFGGKYGEGYYTTETKKNTSWLKRLFSRK